MSSPFDFFANSVLIFKVSGDTLAADAFGNRIKSEVSIAIKAMLKEDTKAPQHDELPGVDRDFIKLKGKAIEPMSVPNLIAINSEAAATWNQYRGIFRLDPIKRSPYNTAEILGDSIGGWFQVLGAAGEPDPFEPYVPPAPPTQAGTFEMTFSQSSLSISNLLPVTHDLNTYPSAIGVWDGNGELITPDEIQHQSLNSLAIDLSSFAPIQGVWTLSIGA